MVVMNVVKFCIQPPIGSESEVMYVPLSGREEDELSRSPSPIIPLHPLPLTIPRNSGVPSKFPTIKGAWIEEKKRMMVKKRRRRKKGFRSYFTRGDIIAPDLEDSCDLSPQFQTSLSIRDHAFSQMEEDIDRQRLLGGKPSYMMSDPEIATMTSDLQKKERYERLLRRAKTEDLSEISGIGCLYQCGVDKLGRPVIVFIGKWFKFNEINLDKALLYLIYLLDPLVQKDYIIIYFHTITTTENHPSMAWIRQVYDILQYKHKKNLKSFYIIHPTFWTKIMTWWFTTFMAPQIKHKVHSFSGVEYLYDIIDPDQLEVPAYIIEHDMTINGIRYYKPMSPSDKWHPLL